MSSQYNRVHGRLRDTLRTSAIILLILTSPCVGEPPAGTRLSLECDCGYIDAQDPTGQVWNTYWQSDFRYMNYQDTMKTFNIMQYVVPGDAGGARRFDPANVAIDSGGLHLTVQPTASNNEVPSAGIFTKSQDFHFGTYHFEAQATHLSGTVLAFYIYESDNNEIDIEYVSKNSTEPIVKFSVKPQEYLPNGQASNTTYQEAEPSFDLSLAFHNYSFIWNTSTVLFAIDGNYSATISHNIPQLPGAIALSHWSDGNPAYSGGPPVSPATLVVSRAWAFYNNSNTTLACKSTNTPCSADPSLPSSSPPGRSHSITTRLSFPYTFNVLSTFVSAAVFFYFFL